MTARNPTAATPPSRMSRTANRFQVSGMVDKVVKGRDEAGKKNSCYCGYKFSH
jgi:hypothetical protein